MESANKKLKIGYLPILDHLTLGVAKHFGETFEAQKFPNWDAIMGALEKGELDGAFLMFPLALKLFRERKDITLVLLGHREGQVLVASPSINSISDLKGKMVHVPHRYSTHLLLLAEILKSARLSLDDVALKVGYQDIRTVVDTLASHETDAFIIAEPLGTEARVRKIGKIITLSQDVLAHHIDCVLVLKNDLLEKHHGACEELVESLVKAGMFVNAYPRQASEIGETFLGWPKKILLEALTHDEGHILFWDLLPRLEDFEELQRIAVRDCALWSDEIDLATFVDASLAQKAYRAWMLDERRYVKDRGAARAGPVRVESAIAVRDVLRGEHYPHNVVRFAAGTLTEAEATQRAFRGERIAIETSEAGKKARLYLPAYDPDAHGRIFATFTEEEWKKIK